MKSRGEIVYRVNTFILISISILFALLVMNQTLARSPLSTGEENLSDCGTINTPGLYILNGSLKSTGTCFTITTNNVSIDCNNSVIYYSNTSADSAGNGIQAFNLTNITIKNCNIKIANASIQNSSAAAIYFANTNNSLMENNIVNTSTSASGIKVYGGFNLQIINNTGIGDPAGLEIGGNDGVSMTVGANITNNKGISTYSSIGISIDANDSFVINNNGTSDSYQGMSINVKNTVVRDNWALSDSGTEAIYLTCIGSVGDTWSCHNATNNTGIGINGATGIAVDGGRSILINNTGKSDTGYGLQYASSVSGRYVSTGNTGISGSSYAIDISSIGGNFTGDIGITDGGYAIHIATSAQNNSFANLTLRTNATWIDAANDALNNNATNLTFDSNYGSIGLSSINILNGTTTTTADLNVSLNKAYLNSTLLPWLNTSAVITLKNLSFTNPQPLFDLEDDNSFSVCGSSRCIEKNYSNGIFSFNVTGFTSYSSNETAADGGETPINDSQVEEEAGSGGGGTVYQPTTEQIADGYEQTLATGSLITYTSQSSEGASEQHTITLTKVGEDHVNLTIRSAIIKLTLLVGQEAKLNLSSADYYDLYIKLNSITNNKAAITIRAISEPITNQPGDEQTLDEAQAQAPEEEKEASPKTTSNYIITALVIAIAIILFVIFYKKTSKR